MYPTNAMCMQLQEPLLRPMEIEHDEESKERSQLGGKNEKQSICTMLFTHRLLSLRTLKIHCVQIPFDINLDQSAQVEDQCFEQNARKPSS